jgi:serine phosphatase RsbU (regulator of sigma subunit)
MDDPPMQETFASLLLVRWEPEAHRLTYANAGHCRPLLITPDGPKIVEYSDMILGLDRNADFKDTEVELPADSALIAYTDGLTEQVLQSGQIAGEQGIVDASMRAYGQDAPIDAMLDDVLNRSEEDEFGDDILVLWLQREPLEIDWFSPFAADVK